MNVPLTARTREQLMMMTIPQIREELKNNGINMRGLRLKNDLIRRYLDSISPINSINLTNSKTPIKDVMTPLRELKITLKPQHKNQIQIPVQIISPNADYNIEILPNPPHGCVAFEQGKRPEMEDAHVIAELQIRDRFAILYGVFDGHRSDDVANYLADVFPESLAVYLLKVNNLDDQDEVIDAFEQAIINEDINMYKNGDLHGDRFLGGSTGVMALRIDNDLYVANLGDSRGIVFDQDGNLILETIDHKPNREIHAIMAAKGIVRNNRVGGILAVSRSFGDFRNELKLLNDVYLGVDAPLSSMPDIYPLELEDLQNPTLVLACDGLWDVFSSLEVIDYIRLSPHPITACHDLINEAINKRNSRDNVTVLIAPL